MNVNNFYSKRGPTFTRHLRYIVSRDLPDDGNASDRGGDDDDSEDETENDFEAQCSSSGEESTSEENDSSNDDVDDASAVGREWTDKFSSRVLPKQFTEDEGPLIVLPMDADILEYFDLLFPTSLWKILVTETNRYAEQKGKPFDETDDSEMKAFIGIVLAMSIHNA